MKSFALIFASAITILLTSCAMGPPIEDSRVQRAKTEGLVRQRRALIVPGKRVAPRFSFVGTTAFQNKNEPITEPGYSFSEYLAARLRQKGYKVSIGEDSDTLLNLSLYDNYPYQGDFIYGVGIHKRSLLGMSGPYVAHCNVWANLTDPVTKSFRADHVKVSLLEGAKYFFGPTPLKLKKNRWEQFTPAEKETLRSSLDDYKRQCADHIIKNLNL